MIAEWAKNYIGKEWKEHGRGEEDKYDCWGLVVSVYAKVFQIILPDYHAEFDTILDIYILYIIGVSSR